ncbi:MAG TPA: futalosine hydrolase [Chitinophagaceae bacterium]
MNCLLIAATAQEVAPFLEHYRNSDKTAFIDFNIDVLITGVGMTATTYQLTRYFHLKKPDLAIQAGVAGCFDKNINLGTVVAVKKDVIADEAVVEAKKLKTIFDLKLASPNQFPFTKAGLENPYKAMLKRTKLKMVNAVSVNHISTNREMIKLYEKHFKPVIESMEGAAMHYTCLMSNIPFLQIRSISNYVGERSKQKWKMKESITNLNYELIRLFENL